MEGLSSVGPSAKGNLLESPSASGLADTPAETEGGSFQLHVTPVEPWRARLRGYGNVVRYCKELWERTRIPA